MRVDIVHNYRRYYDLEELEEEGLSRGFDARLVHIDNFDISADVVVNRLSPEAEDSDLLSFHPQVINSFQSYDRARDKVKSYHLMNRFGIPTPNILVGGKDFVVKPRFGARCENISSYNGDWIVQQTIKTSLGRDIRVFMIGSDPYIAKIRYSDQYKEITAHVNDKEDFYEIDDDLKNLCARTMGVFGLDVAGIDVLFGENGYLICDINATPAKFDSFSDWIDESISKRIFDLIEEKYVSSPSSKVSAI